MPHMINTHPGKIINKMPQILTIPINASIIPKVVAYISCCHENFRILKLVNMVINVGCVYSLALNASFRGRGLQGCVLNLPVGYTGYVMKEERRPLTDEEVSMYK